MASNKGDMATENAQYHAAKGNMRDLGTDTFVSG